jgi:translation initiation factor IF-3
LRLFEPLCYPPAATAPVVGSRAPQPKTSKKGDDDISRDLRVNQMIRVPQVRVVDDEGQQLGVMPTPQALTMAQERGLDLVEVAPTAAPPVVRFLDFGQYKYELTKREKEAKRKQRAVEFKEVRLTPKIGQGDFDTKVHRAIEFLEDGDRIKVTVRFRGRELTHPEIGRNLLAKFGDAVKDHGTVDRLPILEGKSMFMTLASVHKPRVHEHRVGGHRADDEHSPEPALGLDGEEMTVDAQPAAVAEPATVAEAAPTEPKPVAEPKPATEPKPAAAKPAAAKPAAAAKAATIAETTPIAEASPAAEPEPKTESTPVPEAAPVGE